MSKKLQIVTFKQAKKLKELGFDWEVDKCYDKCEILSSYGKIFELINYNETSKWSSCVSAPTVVLALKWLKEEKKILVLPFPIDDWNSWNYKTLGEDVMCPFVEFPINNELEHASQEEAELAGLDFALDNLVNPKQIESTKFIPHEGEGVDYRFDDENITFG